MKLINLSLHKNPFMRWGFWLGIAIVTLYLPIMVFTALSFAHKLWIIWHLGAFITIAVVTFFVQLNWVDHFREKPEDKEIWDSFIKVLIYRTLLTPIALTLYWILILIVDFHREVGWFFAITFLLNLPEIIIGGTILRIVDFDYLSPYQTFFPTLLYLVVYGLFLRLVYQWVKWSKNKKLKKELW